MIPREAYLEKVRPFFNKDLVKVLTGIRRSGKSTLFKLIQQELIADGVLTPPGVSLLERDHTPEMLYNRGGGSAIKKKMIISEILNYHFSR